MKNLWKFFCKPETRMLRLLYLLAAAVAWIGLAFPVGATLLTNTPSKDNTIYETSGSTNYLSNGAGDTLTAGRIDLSKAGGWRRRSMLAFTNLHNLIPAGATINSASLRMYCSQTTAGALPVSLHRLTRNWGEGTANVNGGEGKGITATTGDATWYLRFAPTNSTVWTAPGGDFISQASATTSVNANGVTYSWSSATLAADVQLWVNNAATNFGWAILGDETSYHTAKAFSSRESKTSANWPVLIVDYSTAQPVGACFLPDGSCTTTTSNQCVVVLGGVWGGAGTVCPPSTGACCLPSGACTNTTATNCTALGGVYQGDNVACVSNLCPVVLTPFVDPLPLPPIATPVSGTIGGVATYEIRMQQFTNKVHRDLPATTFWGYNGVTPGPIIVASSGAPVTVRYINDLREANGAYRTSHYLPVDTCLEGANIYGALPRAVVHLHGGHVPPESDGNPEATILPGEEVTYVYPNQQPASLIWFHDHALGITRLNVYMGLAGAYLIRDAAEAALGLPSGEFEVPLVIQDRKFNPDGSLYYPPTWQPDFFGDKMMVNGKVWPYHNVKRGKYRLRLLNGCNGRTLALGFDNGMNFQQIGTDGGFLSAPVATNLVCLGPGERADVIVDFQNASIGAQITLTNGAPAPFPGSPGVGVLPNVMRFTVVAGSSFTGAVPVALVPVVPLSTNAALTERTLELYKVSAPCTGERWTINGLGYSDMITEMPTLGDTEIWRFVNKSGMSHPMHMHLVMFQVLDRQAVQMVGDQAIPVGPRIPPPANEAGWKDTVQVMPYEITRVITRFDGYTGPYPYHCHILEHEENDMMRRFLVLPPVYPPGITTQPTNQTVLAGTLATFSLSVTGTPPLAVQWYFTNSPIADATNLSHTVMAAHASDAGDYFARITNSAGAVTSSVATLTVFEYPSIVTHPHSQTVPVGSNITLTVTAAGTPPLAYQWRHEGVPLEGKTATDLSLPAIQLAHAGAYDAVVTNSYGSITSSVATLTVFEYPSIATHPQSQTVPVGSNVTLTVTAAGTPPLAHQWRFGAAALPGETATNLSLSNFQWTNAGTYDVVVANTYGAITSSIAVLGIFYPEAELIYGWDQNLLSLQWLGTNWQLQSSDNLGAWALFPEAPLRLGPTNLLSLPTTNAGQFFRLIRD